MFKSTKCKLSVNINKIATLRNARGEDTPDVLEAAQKIEQFGADGITVHPRPDERHIRYADVRGLKSVIKTELNVEGYPSKNWMDLVLGVCPHQATLVPDAANAITSNAGWDTIANQGFLSEVVSVLKGKGIRTSIFVSTEKKHIEGAKKCGADRVELYTKAYADGFRENAEDAVASYVNAAMVAHKMELGVNAGHDLSLQNLEVFARTVQHLNEVSIGHALISDSLYFGLENSVQMYKSKLS